MQPAMLAPIRPPFVVGPAQNRIRGREGVGAGPAPSLAVGEARSALGLGQE